MPATVWTGNGQNVAQQITLVVTAVALNGTLSAILNGKSVTYTCTGTDTTATAASGWQALLASRSAPPEFQEISWSVNTTTSTITGVAKTPGNPFMGTGTGSGGLSKSQAGGATCTLSQTVANSSQSDVGNPANWLRNGVPSLPQAGDDVVVAGTSVPLNVNLTALSGITVASWTRYQSFTGAVGLPANNPAGYVEYRPTYLQLASSVNPALGAFPLVLGPGGGSGPTLERYDMQSYRASLVVTAAGTPSDTYAVRFLGSHGQNALTVVGVKAAVCMLPTEVSPNGATISQANVDGGGTLDLGAGCSFAGTAGGGTITITGGTSTLYNTPSSVVARNNATVTLAAQNGTYTNVSATSNTTVNVTCAMTISVLSVTKSSNINFSNSLGAVTITTSSLDGDTCQAIDPNNCASWTGATTVNGQVTSGPFQFTGTRTVKIT